MNKIPRNTLNKRQNMHVKNDKTLPKDIKDTNKWKENPCSEFGTANIVKNENTSRIDQRIQCHL